MAVDRDVEIEMDDGITLRADVFRPAAEGQHAALLSYGPYGKDLPFADGYPDQWRLMTTSHPEVTAGSTNRFQNWEVVDPEKWVPAGYVCVRVDSRGAGRSAGVLDCWSPRETRDLYECIEWAGRQAWSNGRVGLNGISYYAINQWQVAALQPPHLAAICVWEGAADHYRDISSHGGIPCAFAANWYPAQVTIVQHGLGARGLRSSKTGALISGPETLSEAELERNRVDLGAQIAAHPLDDEFHRLRTPDFSRIEVPLLSCANWGGQGLHSRGNFEGFVRSGSKQKWLECHGLEHWTHFYTDHGRELQQRFFDHFLKEEDNGWNEEPRVLLQVRHPGERFETRKDGEWPLARTVWTHLYLDAAIGGLVPTPGASTSVTYSGLGEGVSFSTPPLSEVTEITGPLAAKLFVSASTSDADLFLIVRVFDEHDDEVTFQGTLDPHTPIAQGWLRASHRELDPELSEAFRPYHRHERERPLVPGEVYELDVEIWPTSIVIPKGHRIVLTVQGKDFEYGGEAIHVAWFTMRGCGPFTHDGRPVDVYGGDVTLHTGADHPSFLLVPMIPSR
jgi:putative CocE/NonD family hydrolase